MKKVLLGLLLLAFVVPAMGAVNITLVQGPEPNSVLVNYACTAGEKVRAFALDLAVTDSALITSSVLRQGLKRPQVDDANYYLTPTNASFTSLGTPSTLRVWSYGSPIVAADPCKGVIEMASLYSLSDPCVAHRFAPPAAGTLVKLFVQGEPNSKKIGCDGAVTVSVTGANAKRGGVVLEDGSTVAIGAVTSLTMQLYTGPLAWLSPSQPKGDANADNIVDGFDVLAVKKSWNKTPADPHGTANGQFNCACDFNHDGIVDGFDVLIIKQNWNKGGWGTCPSNCP